jgi:hypothetical protein
MTRFLDLHRMARVLLIGLAWCLWPVQAQGQAYPCNGAGPGERVVGMSPAAPGVASFPLCVRDESSNAPAEPAAAHNSYAAIAWHPDAADIWVDGNYSGGDNIAQREVLAACNSVMGGGCSLAGDWGNSSMVIIRDRNGSFYRGWAGEGGAERRQVLADCSAKQLLPCEIFATIRSSTNRRSPGASARKFYAASAWVVGLDGYDHKLYIASGQRSADAATGAAIKACRDATSRPCESTALTGNGFIQAYRMNGNSDSATVETSAKRAQQAARVNCKKQSGTSCELQALFDSRKPGLFVHEFAKAKTP